MIYNTEQSWGTVAKALHWVMALLIFTMFVLGWVAVAYPLSPTKLDLFIWHKSIGLSLLGLVCVRLIWRVVNTTPMPPAAISSYEHTLARLGHATLYLLMILMPLSGYVINSTADFGFRFFGWVRVPNLIAPNKAWQETAETVHFVLFLAFVVVILIHIAAALRHHFVRNNNVLTRMLPSSSHPYEE